MGAVVCSSSEGSLSLLGLKGNQKECDPRYFDTRTQKGLKNGPHKLFARKTPNYFTSNNNPHLRHLPAHRGGLDVAIGCHFKSGNPKPVRWGSQQKASNIGVLFGK